MREGWLNAMPSATIQVYIVDDEPSVCTAYARLMRSARMQPWTFASVEDLVRAELRVENACIVSDIQFPGRSGLELPELLERAGYSLPIIYVTAHDTVESREAAQRSGATAYFRKPVDDQALIDAIAWAVSAGNRAATSPSSPKPPPH